LPLEPVWSAHVLLSDFGRFDRQKSRCCWRRSGGQRKIETLLRYGAKVQVISMELTSELRRYVEEGEITYLGSEFRGEHIDGAFLVIAATDDPSLNQAVSACAREKGILVNAVDQPGTAPSLCLYSQERRPRHCRVHFRKEPAIAKKIRKDLENRYGREYEMFLALLGN